MCVVPSVHIHHLLIATVRRSLSVFSLCVSPMTLSLTFFLCLLAIFILAFENYLLISLSYLLIGMFVFWILTLSQMYSWQRFSTALHSASFTGFTVLSTGWEVLNFMQSHFSVLGFTSWMTRVLVRKSLPIPVPHSVFWLYLLTVSEFQFLC